MLGTPMYLAPEQARGPAVDARTDVYALGCLAYELVLGRLPFAGSPSIVAIMAAHMHQRRPARAPGGPDIPLDLVLFGLLAKAPASRPILAQLRAVLADLIPPRRIRHAQPRKPSSRRARPRPPAYSSSRSSPSPC